ncbi:MAG: DUF1351 domain-containing protein [Deltaproteobacteria bacterium]
MNLEILEGNMPVIRTNFELVKKNLISNLDEYKNLVVTEQSLSVCKSKREELAGLSRSIDKNRLEVKKEYSKPIVEFEEKCKELMSLINEVKGSIDAGIKVFDDKTREQKKQFAITCIAEISKELELREKYSNQIQFQERYCNLSITQKEVREDIRSQALELNIKQMQEDLRRTMAENTITLLNETLNLTNKLTVDEFKSYIEYSDSEPEVIAEIVKKEALKRKEIEEKAIQQEKERLAQEAERKAIEEQTKLESYVAEAEKAEILDKCITTSEEPISDFEKSLLEEEPIRFTIFIKAIATQEELNDIRDFLKNKAITHSIRIEA